MKKLTQHEFIERAKAVHGDLYGYLKTVYIDSRHKVIVTCPIHGDFETNPIPHITRGSGCPLCSKYHKMDREEFVRKAVLKHGHKYDYSPTVYIKSQTKVKINCPVHGLFEQIPAMHLHGQGCPQCANERKGSSVKLTKEEFVKRSIAVHGFGFDYTQSDYIDTNTKVLIICNTCGKSFYQTPHRHMQGQGCSYCAGVHRKTKDEFIEELKSIYGDTLIYDKIEYVNSITPVVLECVEHGEFEQSPKLLLKGHACQKCKRTSGEKRVVKYLEDNKIDFIEQKTFRNESVLSERGFLRVDFYIPSRKTVIEYNGGQHYFPVEIFGGEEAFRKQQERDYALKLYCKNHELKLIEISYKDYGKIEEILNKKLNRGFRK